ncbi:MAG: hypothetical protein E6G48_07300, partial [Actinobacteria bacterium]
MAEPTPPAEPAATPDTPAKPMPTLVYSGPTMREAAEQLREKKAEFREGGGADKVERQRSLGKLTVRERLDLLFDPGTFEEMGLLAHHQGPSPQMQGKFTPADGCVCGVGRVNGRRAAVIAYDFTVMAGSIGMVG